jgi:cytochrome P450
VNVDLTSAGFQANPYPVFARLRDEAPVCRVTAGHITLPQKQAAWLVTRYDDVSAALRDERLIKNKASLHDGELVPPQRWFPSLFCRFTRNLLDLDPPEHTRLRALVQESFAARSVESMRGRLENLSEELLCAAERRGRLDVVGDFAMPLAVTAIAEALGVPARDGLRIHRWSTAVMAGGASYWRLGRALPNRAVFIHYLQGLVDAPSAGANGSLLSWLISDHTAGRLSRDELLSMLFLLLVAGHETTMNLIGLSALALARHPEQMAPVLPQTAIEELLRYDNSVAVATERFAREDLEIGGVHIRRGELVVAAIASANRDETHFARPYSLDLTRANNRHLSFGHGPHHCVGAALGRLEVQVAVAALARRLRGWRMVQAPERLQWRPGLVFRGLRELWFQR